LSQSWGGFIKNRWRGHCLRAEKLEARELFDAKRAVRRIAAVPSVYSPLCQADSFAIKMIKKTERELKCGDDYTDNCRNDSDPLNFGNFVFQENNSQSYSHY